jgi:hypothetical protein
MNQLALVMKKPGSGRLNNSPGTNTTGADLDMHRAAITGHHSNVLQVGQPAATGLVMGVADVIPGRGAFATNFTITGHDIFS